MENAIAETAKKYGRYCRRIDYNILHSEEDREEFVIPESVDKHSAAAAGMPVRLSGVDHPQSVLDWYKRSTAQKRGGGQVSLSLDERKESVPVPGSVERAADDFALTKALNRFRASLTPQARTIFMRRYQNCPTADYLREEYAALLARDDVQINMHGGDYWRRAIRSSSTAAPGTREAYFMPYYRFYVEIPAAEKDGGMKTYGAYYAPAVEQTYIAEMPVWDGCFN